MADTPEVLKRLEEIGADLERPCDECGEACHSSWVASSDDMRFLLRLTRALLDSQGELMEWQQAVRRTVLSLGSVSITTVDEIAARAERVRKGEV